MMTFRILLLVALVLASAQASSVAQNIDDTTTMVIMGPKGPVLARMMITVDRQPYRLWVTSFLAQRVDMDEDGTLNRSELELIPSRLMQQTSAKNAKRALKKSSGDKKAENVEREAFSKWFAGQLTNSFNLIAGAVQASEAVRLASYMDANGDGRVSEEEVLTAARSMRFRDLDNDQTFSASELLPYRDPRNQQAAVVPDAANLPFVQLTDEAAFERTTAQILKRYGDGETVTREALRIPASDTKITDDVFDAPKLKHWLKTSYGHFTFRVKLSEEANASQLQFLMPTATKVFCRFEPEADRRGRGRLVVDDMPITIRARSGSKITRGYMVNFLLQKVSLFDEDKNGYLDEEEFPAIAGELASMQVVGTFKDIDLNGDEMVFRDEIRNYIERDAIVAQSRIEVSVQQDGKTLFKLLDENEDRRLTQRELNTGFAALKEFDMDKDDHLTEAELGTAYALQIGLGQVESMRMENRSMNMQGSRTDAVLPGLAGLEGPQWFRRMDRNQDRDVSAREFLGPVDIFKKLDTDNDGLLNATEAKALDPADK